MNQNPINICSTYAGTIQQKQASIKTPHRAGCVFLPEKNFK